MSFGHLLAVTVKLVQGTLTGPTLLFYVIGIAMIVPASWLVVFALRAVVATNSFPSTVSLNSWLVLTLLVIGPHNLPLAAPGLLNIAYRLHSGRALGWVLVTLALLINGGLFIGSLIFFASGQSFEQFRGIG